MQKYLQIEKASARLPEHFHTAVITGRISSMPWPATHILIAEQLYARYFSHLDQPAFIIGTCFPDIRYPARIGRELTHFSGLTLSQISAQPAFQAGMSFHTFVDQHWNGYVRAHHTRLFAKLPHNRAIFHTMKILQDKYLYHEIDAWRQVASYLDEVLPEEHAFGIDAGMLELWHTMLSNYLQKPPNFEDLNMLSLSLPDDLLSEIRGYCQIYEHHPALKQVMIGFYVEFEDLLGSCPD